MCTTKSEFKPVPKCTSTVKRRRPVAGPVIYWQGSSPEGRSQLPNLSDDKVKGLRHEKNLVVKHCCTEMNSLK